MSAPTITTETVTTNCGHKVPKDETVECSADPWDDPYCEGTCYRAHLADCTACLAQETDDNAWED